MKIIRKNYDSVEQAYKYRNGDVNRHSNNKNHSFTFIV